MSASTEILFYRVNEPYGSFSNFSKHPIFLAGTTWTSSEHFFQAEKFEDVKDRWDIQHALSPADAARMGRDHKRKLRKDWELVKDDVMRKAVLAKVMQHADVRELLLSTGDAVIIEHTTNDDYWADGGDGSGRNMLGKILMEIRAELLRSGPYDELKEPLLPPWLKYPELDSYSIGWRMGYGESYVREFHAWYKGLSEDGKHRYHLMFTATGEWEGYWTDPGPI